MAGESDAASSVSAGPVAGATELADVPNAAREVRAAEHLRPVELLERAEGLVRWSRAESP